jgi:hypothetical protein
MDDYPKDLGDNLPTTLVWVIIMITAIRVTRRTSRCLLLLGLTLITMMIPQTPRAHVPVGVYAGTDHFARVGAQVTLAGEVGKGVVLSGMIWSQVAGTPVSLSGGDTLTPSFTVPMTVESLRFRLTGEMAILGSVSDDVIVTVLEDTEHAVFVSSTLGDDADPGTREAPVQTLHAAFDVASLPTCSDTGSVCTLENPACNSGATCSRSDIYVHEGDYNESDTLTVLNDMSLYGGFRAIPFIGIPWHPTPPIIWGRTASTPTRISGATTAIKGLDVTSSPTTIDGLSIESADNASTGGITFNVDGNGFFLRLDSQYDVNEVWLVHYEPVQGQVVGNKISTQVTSDLSMLIPCDEQEQDPDITRYLDELQLNVPILKDPSSTPPPQPYYLFEFNQAFFCSNGVQLYVDFDDGTLTDAAHATPFPGHAFVKEWNLHPGYDLLRETVFLNDAEDTYPTYHTEYEQVLRGPDGYLYIDRNPGFLYPYELHYGPDDPDPPGGPGPDIDHSLQQLDPLTGSTFWGMHPYDITEDGGLGGDSIGIHVFNANDNLRIANNTIVAGWGNSGDAGSDGPDGGKGGSGGGGGDSIGISLFASSAFISENTISTAGGGYGGNGGSNGLGATGGDSCGIYPLQNSVPTLGRNCFTQNCDPALPPGASLIGLAGSGGIPGGANGTRGEICRIPVATIPVGPVDPGGTVNAAWNVPMSTRIGTFVSAWSGSDIVMTLISPSGRIIDRNTNDLDINHVLGPTFESYSILGPEPGSWTGSLFGADVPAEGEEVSVSVLTTPNNSPIAKCQDVIVEAPTCEADVAVDGGSFDPDGDPITLDQWPPGPYGLGETDVTLTVNDDMGESDFCIATVTLVDKQSPTIAGPIASPASLWPPNHNMIPINVVVSASDNCDTDPIVELTDVQSSEGDAVSTFDPAHDVTEIEGRKGNDIQLIDGQLFLRAERSGKSDGRMYTITYQATDASGNSNSAIATVEVPHNQ